MRYCTSCLPLAVAVGLLAGCSAAIRSSKVTGEQDHVKKGGIAYFLPKKQLRLMAEFVEEQVTNRLDVPVPSTNWWSTNYVATNVVGTNALAVTNRVFQAAESVGVALSFARFEAKQYYRVSLEEQTVPDPNGLYLLQLVPKPYADDSYYVGVTSNGLLSSINVTNADQRGELVKVLAQTAIEVLKDVSVGPSVEGLSKQKVATTNLHRLTIDFDPTDERALSNANSLLKGVATVDVQPFRAEEVKGMYFPGRRTPDRAAGVFYRPSLPYLVTVRSKAEVISSTVSMPNEAPVLEYDIRRASLVSQSTALVFKNGLLTEVSLQKPSEYLAAAKIPLEIAKSVASIPTNLIQLKIDLNTANKGLADSQAAQISALSNLLQAQMAYAALLQTNRAGTNR